MSENIFTLPPLDYAYEALEPAISRQIMRLHHDKHHQTYVNNLNAAIKAQATALANRDIVAQVDTLQAIKFNGGGHINHSLFWKGLAPPGFASESSAPALLREITKIWSSFDSFKESFSAVLLGIQGSGWGWLVKDVGTQQLSIVTTKDQDTVASTVTPIFGVDMWEHAYYLQYENGKANYVKNIWMVINWKTAESRFNGSRDEALKLLYHFG